MKIIKMTATFGGLDRATLTPGPGLTVISAPNERGKSTWAGFLKAMLYGIDTKERDKTGFLADKNRYQPWSGAPMSGELQVEWQGKDITIRRFGVKNNPFGGFEAVYTATGDPVPGLTAANVGEQLTGAGREVFLRSAFVGQNGAPISQNGELEARIAALATSGQEDVSWSATERTLKDWRNRRRANRSNGLIPDAQQELSGLEQSLRAMAQTRQQAGEAEEHISRLKAEKASLESSLEIWARLEAHELNRRYGQALEQLSRAEDALAALTPPDPEIADWTAQEIRDWADDREAQYRAELSQREALLARQRELEERSLRTGRLAIAGAVLFALAAVVLAFFGWKEFITFNPNWCMYLLVAACACLIWRNRSVTKTFQAVQDMDIPEEPIPQDWQEEVRRHVDYLTQKERLEQEVRHAKDRADDLAARGGRPFDTLELLHAPELSRQDARDRLALVTAELARQEGQLARCQGALQQMGDADTIRARMDELGEEITRRTGEFDAINTAMEVLSEANDTLRQRFSPALNREAGAIFSALTGGRWPNISLARDFTAQASGADSPLPHSWLSLSAGTADQLYLSVRLAICRLSLPSAPIVLDDALTAFDDERMALAMDCLAELSRERQILLFSCHSRESRWAEERNLPVLFI